MDQLRAERLQRESSERKRSEQLLNKGDNSNDATDMNKSKSR